MNDEHKGVIIQALTEQIFSSLMKQDFEDWYAGRFDAFVTGDLEEVGTESHLIAETLIKKDIQRLFNLV
jgi:hypothetical protein